MYSRFQYIHIKLLILVAIVSLAASKHFEHYAYEGFIGSKHKPYEVGSSSSRLSKIDLTASNFNFPLPTYENAPTTGSSNRIPDSKYQHRTITDFQTRSSRLGFIRKVYSIFGAQIVGTIAVAALIMSNDDLKYTLLRNGPAVSILTSLGSTGILIALTRIPDLRYKSPRNFIMLGLFTLFQSVLVGMFSSAVDPSLVAAACMHTLTAFLAITAYSFQPNPKYDLTAMGNMFLAALTSVFIGSLLNIFMRIPLLENVLTGLMAILFAAYIAHDTQKIVGGKNHKYQFGEKEYILAALNVYQDVIGLFIEILKILAKINANKDNGREKHSNRRQNNFPQLN